MTRYDISRSYDWNYENAPREAPHLEVAPFPGAWNFCGLPTASPLGMPAGPLLNSNWILYYAALGFDVLTYKTVRSRHRKCYEPPNLVLVDADQLTGSGDRVGGASRSRSWAISFGMPSKDPAEWTRDIERARLGVRRDQVLVVSVVASPEDGWTLNQIAQDFVQCARWAKEAGAQVVEANLSCPNVCSQEGQLYMSPEASREISGAIAAVLGDVPLVLKIGLFTDPAQAAAFVQAVGEFASALSTVNSISAAVLDQNGKAAFGGMTRGVGGECIRDRCSVEAGMLADTIRQEAPRLRLVGVGGIATADDARQRLAAGAHHVQIATAAMLDPLIAVRIREEIAAAVSAAPVSKGYNNF